MPGEQTSLTDNLDPTTGPSASTSLILYAALSGDTTLNRSVATGAKVYFPFRSNMLLPKVTTPITALVDPWGNPYGYSTARMANPSGSIGFNPTFDLWSTANAMTNQNSWVKNW